MASFDLRRILAAWPYESGQITVRKIRGDDGRMKIQMRLDLGLLQMDVEGRPDGQQPFGSDSLLEYRKGLLEEHIQRNGTELGFQLSPEDCQALREEAAMYYHRYLSLFVLEEFDGVERDTARNLAVLDLCKRYAIEEDDRLALEPYRSYLIMMNARAKSHQAIRRSAFKTALAYIDAGIHDIREVLTEAAGEDEAEDCTELEILVALREEIAQRVPADPVRTLQERLARAVREERYEEAAQLRDRLQRMQTQKSPRRTRKKTK